MSATTDATPDLARLAQAIVNLYFYGRRGAPNRSWVLLDAGLPLGADQILRAAAERYGPRSRPAAVVLTHGHLDHVGALPEVADRGDARSPPTRWNCPT